MIIQKIQFCSQFEKKNNLKKKIHFVFIWKDTFSKNNQLWFSLGKLVLKKYKSGSQCKKKKNKKKTSFLLKIILENCFLKDLQLVLSWKKIIFKISTYGFYWQIIFNKP